MARCVACNKQINFGDDLCKRCNDAVASVYKPTQEDITNIENMMYSVRNPRLLDNCDYSASEGEELIDEEIA